MKTTRKSKRKETPQQQIPADNLIQIAELYSSMVNSARKNRRQGGKVEDKTEGLLKEIFEKLQNRNPVIDVQSLFQSLHYLLSWKTFDSISEGKAVEQDLRALNIEVPALVQNCLQEIEMRSRLVKDYSIEKHQWSGEKIQNWKDEIESTLQERSYHNSSRQRYLDGLINDAVDEIKRLENETIKKYGYKINGFFKASSFVATEIDLNNFFFHSEIEAGGYTAFHDIFNLFSKYIDRHNELVLLKSLIKSYASTDTQGITDGGEVYIMPELLKRLQGVEKGIQPLIGSWTKIMIAAWVELLMDKGYFQPEYRRTKRRQNCIEFSKIRYGVIIKIQMMPKEDHNRKTHKAKLEKHFK